MSKNTAPQTAPIAPEKKERKPLFGLSQDVLKLVSGGGGVITTGPHKP